MLLLGIGGNLPCDPFGPPRATAGAALEALETHNVRISARGRWYESAPVPVSDQPWFVNTVVAVETDASPQDLMGILLDVEAELGRRRSVANAARTVDIDILAYHDAVIDAPDLIIPHPRLHTRAFVLLPLRDIAPEWSHPESGRGIDGLIAELPADQVCRPIADADGMFGTEWVPAQNRDDSV